MVLLLAFGKIGEVMFPKNNSIVYWRNYLGLFLFWKEMIGIGLLCLNLSFLRDVASYTSLYEPCRETKFKVDFCTFTQKNSPSTPNSYDPVSVPFVEYHFEGHVP